MGIVYVLECKHNKYYVGYTNQDNIDNRLKSHKRGKVQWIRIHPFVKVLETIYNSLQEDEDKYVKIYMEKYGTDNVRGGSYSQIELGIIKEKCTLNNTCFKCNRKGHYSNKCQNQKYFDKIQKAKEKSNKTFDFSIFKKTLVTENDFFKSIGYHEYSNG